MKKMLNIKKLGGLVAFGFLCAPAFAQTPSQNGMPFDESTKQAWIKAHPAEYNQMTNQTVERSTAPMTEAAKKAWINANPAEYARQTNATVYPWGTESNKSAWVAAHPAEYETFVKGKTFVTRAEFEALPAGKQQAMLADPNYVVAPITK